MTLRTPSHRRAPNPRGFTLVELVVCMAIVSLTSGAVALFVSRYVARIEMREAYIALERQARLLREQVATDLTAAVAMTHAPSPDGGGMLFVERLPGVTEGGALVARPRVLYRPDDADPTRLLRVVGGEGSAAPVEAVTVAAFDVERVHFAPAGDGVVRLDVTLHRSALDEDVRVTRSALLGVGGAR